MGDGMTATLYLNRRLILVSAAAEDQANDAAVSVVGEEAGRHTFTVPVPQDGKATHYIANWAMTKQEESALRAALQPLIDTGQCVMRDASDIDEHGNAKSPEWTQDSVLAAEGLRAVEREGMAK